MSKNSPGDELPVRRIDRILAFMSLGLIGLSIVSFFAIMIATAADADFSTPLWRTVGVIVYVAPIAAFAMLLIVLISTFVRRSRANRSQ